MKQIKQITFDITQSRRIKNFAQKKKIEEKQILGDYQKIMHLIFQSWKKNHLNKDDISFRNYFLQVMKYAEFAFRLHQREEEMTKIVDHVEILRDALEEYERDYSDVIEIENIVKGISGGIDL